MHADTAVTAAATIVTAIARRGERRLRCMVLPILWSVVVVRVVREVVVATAPIPPTSIRGAGPSGLVAPAGGRFRPVGTTGVGHHGTDELRVGGGQRLEAAAQRAGLDASRPKLMNFLKRIHARPAYRRALERGGPYSFAE